MTRKLLITGSLIALAFELMADFPTDFQEAKKLFDAKRNIESQEAFEKIAATAPTPKSKSECLSYAAKAIGRDKSKYDLAIEAAKKIEIKEVSITTQMNIMQENLKFKEVFDTFKDEDFSTWQEVYQLQAYSIRGRAGQLTGQNDAAKKDLLNAVKTAGSDMQAKINALTSLKDAYGQTKDYDNVIRTSKQIFEMNGFKGQWTYLTAVLSCANAQLAQGKPDEALETMKLMDNIKDGVYKCMALIVYGDIYVAQGKKDEAAAKYKEAMATKGQTGVHDMYIAQAQKKLEALGK